MTIKELRKSKKLTQAAFAEAIGLNKYAVTSLEIGRKKLTDEISAKIKEVFGVDVKAEKKSGKNTKNTAKRSKVDTAPKKSQVKKGVIIQSPMGGEITPDEILAKIKTATKGTGVGKIDTIYVRVDENKAYWVKGKKNGSVDLW